MSPVMLMGLIPAVVALYAVCGGITYGVLYNRRLADWRSDSAFMGSIFWPFVLVLGLPAWLMLKVGRKSSDLIDAIAERRAALPEARIHSED